MITLKPLAPASYVALFLDLLRRVVPDLCLHQIKMQKMEIMDSFEVHGNQINQVTQDLEKLTSLFKENLAEQETRTLQLISSLETRVDSALSKAASSEDVDTLETNIEAIATNVHQFIAAHSALGNAVCFVVFCIILLFLTNSVLRRSGMKNLRG